LQIKEIPMKRIIVVFSFVLALTLSCTAHAASAWNAQEHLSKKQLASLVVSAKTPAEHQRMAVDFEKNPATNNDKVARTTVDHCQYLAKSLQARAAMAAGLAQQHEEMAKEAGNQ
jgi:peroxiredoxin